MSKLATHLVRNAVDVVSNKTLTAADQGIVQNVTVDGVIITLPSTANGLTFTVRNNGGKISGGVPAGATSDGTVQFTVAPAAADGIQGLGLVSAANKGIINVKSTSKIGDEITVEASGTAGVSAWNVNEAFGIFTRVA